MLEQTFKLDSYRFLTAKPQIATSMLNRFIFSDK